MTTAEISQAIATSSFVDLGDSPDFGWEKVNMKKRFFSFSIVNNTDNDHTVLLCPSDTPSSAKIIKDAADGNIGGVAGLTAVSSVPDKTIAQLLAHIARIPTRVLATQFESANSSQLNKVFMIQDHSLHGNPAKDQFPLSSMKSRQDTDKTVVTVPKVYQLDYETEVSIAVPARVSEDTPTRLDVTFYFGAELNVANALYRMAFSALQDSATAARFNATNA